MLLLVFFIVILRLAEGSEILARKDFLCYKDSLALADSSLSLRMTDENYKLEPLAGILILR